MVNHPQQCPSIVIHVGVTVRCIKTAGQHTEHSAPVPVALITGPIDYSRNDHPMMEWEGTDVVRVVGWWTV